jgi:RNA polymerase sigma factor (sigma-70 family)
VGAKTSKYAKGTAKGVTPAQLRRAEEGIGPVLGQKFSAAWIAKNWRDLLGQANIEYAEWLKDNDPARNPVGWILKCAYWRAINLLDSETRKPRSTSLDAVFHLADESTPTPEQQALDNDRQRRLREALRHLSKKERELLAMVYFEEMSIREAGRKLGWRKSAADRHHSAAMKKMLALVGDRKLLSPAILGPAAWAVVNGEARRALGGLWDAALGPLREGVAFSTEVAEDGAHRVAELARRLSPFTETSNAAAASGSGRVLGYCGTAAGVVVCGLLGSGAVGPGVGGLAPAVPKPTKARAVEYQQAVSPTPTAKLPTPELRLPKRPPPSATPASEGAQPTHRRARNPLFRAPVATGHQDASEFGNNNFKAGSTPESSPPSEAPAESSPPPAPAPSSGSSGSQSSGSSATSEFGL